MNQTRQEKLQKILEDILESDNVYFQPPAAVKMKYPAIVYHMSSVSVKYANNKPYVQSQGYVLTLITKYPNSKYYYEILCLPYCRFDRHYTANGLNHEVFTLFY